jgi:hypothetical protein
MKSNKEIRLEMFGEVQEMWNYFRSVAKVAENEEEIKGFIEAKDRFHAGLMEIAKREDGVEDKERRINIYPPLGRVPLIN